MTKDCRPGLAPTTSGTRTFRCLRTGTWRAAMCTRRSLTCWDSSCLLQVTIARDARACWGFALGLDDSSPVVQIHHAISATRATATPSGAEIDDDRRGQGT